MIRTKKNIRLLRWYAALANLVTLVAFLVAS
uniref:Uncharacterized protein n=1 Tax=Rhizophora mucronata TaxID=61149 RepID=A0A2P2IKM4_RHIMU